jgi:hypothetical protein
VAFVVTNEYLARAKYLGIHRANRERDMGLTKPNEDIWNTALNMDDFLFQVTGEKIDVEDSDNVEAFDLVNEFENNYYDTWEEESN